MSRRANRLSFKGKLLIIGAAAAALVIGTTLGPGAIRSDAEACPRHYYRRDPRPSLAKVKGRWEVKLQYYYKYYSFRGGSYRLSRVYVFTKDKKMATWVHQNGSTSTFWSAVRKGMQRYHCGDLLKGKRLVRLEQGVAKAIGAFYQSKTKRKPGKMDVMLDVTSYWRRYCNPPSKPPRSKSVP